MTKDELNALGSFMMRPWFLQTRPEVKHPCETKKLIDLAVSSPWSLAALCDVKLAYNLTDYGVETAIDFAAPRAISIYVVAQFIK